LHAERHVELNAIGNGFEDGKGFRPSSPPSSTFELPKKTEKQRYSWSIMTSYPFIGKRDAMVLAVAHSSEALGRA